MKKNVMLVFVGIILSVITQTIATTIISSESVGYTNSKTSETTVNGALDELFSAVDINEKIAKMEEEMHNNRSHIGMIVQSSTLDTMEKVIDMYGGTKWTKIEGRFLLGQSSSYSVSSTGGTENNTLSVANLPSHNHSIPALSGSTNNTGAHTHKMFASSSLDVGIEGSANSVPLYFRNGLGDDSYHILASSGGATMGNTGSAGAHEHTVTINANTTGNQGSGTAVNNMPPYKVVYIWERTA